MPDPSAVLERFERAMNEHDVEALVDCFEPDYRSEQPVNPDRDFRGRETVRQRWTSIFASVPDFRAELVRTAVGDDSVWSEWRLQGTRGDGSPIDVRGVMIAGTNDDRIAWARVYWEQVGAGGGGMRVEAPA